MGAFRPALSAVVVMLLLSPTSKAEEKTITAPLKKFSEWVKLDPNVGAMPKVIVEPTRMKVTELKVEVEYTGDNGSTLTQETTQEGGPIRLDCNGYSRGLVKVRVLATRESVEVKITASGQ